LSAGCGTPCQPHGSNLKVEVTGRIRYPDACVTCKPVAAASTVVTEPVVISEVLGKGTARRDRVEKNREYRATPSVAHDVMLEQNEIAATVLERHDGRWADDLLGNGDVLALPGTGISIPLAELYEGVDFAEAGKPEQAWSRCRVASRKRPAVIAPTGCSTRGCSPGCRPGHRPRR
jgi:Uma2 family endonuclease